MIEPGQRAGVLGRLFAAAILTAVALPLFGWLIVQASGAGSLRDPSPVAASMMAVGLYMLWSASLAWLGFLAGLPLAFRSLGRGRFTPLRATATGAACGGLVCLPLYLILFGAADVTDIAAWAPGIAMMAVLTIAGALYGLVFYVCAKSMLRNVIRLR